MRERFLVLHKSGAILKTNEVTESDFGAVQTGFARVIDLEDMTVMAFPDGAQATWEDLPLRTFDDEAEMEEEEEDFSWAVAAGARRLVLDPRDLLYAAKRNRSKKKKEVDE